MKTVFGPALVLAFVVIGSYVGMAMLVVSHSLCAKTLSPEVVCYRQTLESGFWGPILGAAIGCIFANLLIALSKKYLRPRP